MDPRESFKLYPRKDTQYTRFGSLNFELIKTKVFLDRPTPKYHDYMVYLIYAIIGIATGILAVCITGAENEFSWLKVRITQDIIGGSNNNLAWAWVFFTSFSIGLAFIAAVMIVYKAPQAAASGTPELIGYLNGINYSDHFGNTSFIVKVITIILAGVAGLCVGKAGTFVYIGAMIGMGTLYLPIKSFEFFHNDARKREFVSAGMACGIAAAFGSPIGGTLFGFEISQPNTFWEI